MFKLEKEEIQGAILDYYKGSVACAKNHAETLYDMAYRQLNEKNYELPHIEISEEDINELSQLMQAISNGLTKEHYVKSCVESIKEKLKEELGKGNMSNITFPKKKKTTLKDMLKFEKQKRDRISGAISAGVKKMDLEYGGVMIGLGFIWPGTFGAVVGISSNALNTLWYGTPSNILPAVLTGYFSGAILFSTLCNIPNIIKFFKGASASYKNDEKVSFFNKYHQALYELSWIDDFFKNLAEEFKTNLSNGLEPSMPSMRR